jgi:saccharopine dehydrogenase-like NADP-dependent oxidoreductase
MEKIIGVLGASGFVGKNLVNELIENTKNNIIVASRKQKKLQEMYHQFDRIADIFAVDARDKKSLRRFYSEIDMIINCSSPILNIRTIPAEMAVEESIPYIESSVSLLNEHEKNVREIDQNAKEQNILMVTGAGVFPGLSRVLLQLATTIFDTVDTIKISVLFNDCLSIGSAVDMLVESQKCVAVLENGTWISLRLGSLKETMCFPPPFYTQHVYASPPVDTRFHFPKNIQNFSLKTGTCSMLLDSILLMHSINADSYMLTKIMGRYLKYASEINQYFAPCGCVIRMDASGKKKECTKNMNINLYHPNTFTATASVIVQGINFLLKNKVKEKGVFTFGEVMNPIELLHQLSLKNFFVEGI